MNIANGEKNTLMKTRIIVYSIVSVIVIGLIVFLRVPEKTEAQKYTPDLSRLDSEYYRYQEQYNYVLSANECDSNLAYADNIEWHDDLLFCSAIALRQTDPVGMRQRLERIVNEFPHAIHEEEIKYIGSENPRHPEHVLEYRRQHPTMTADRAMHMLAHYEMYTAGNPEKAKYWLERLLTNELGNPRYDDTDFNRTIEDVERQNRPYVQGVEILAQLYQENYPDKYEELLRRFILPNELREVREFAHLKIIELRFDEKKFAEAGSLARLFLKQNPHSIYFDDARSIAEDIDCQEVAK